VLKNYTTYERYFRILQTASEDKVLEGKKASRELMKYVDTHHLNLLNKAKVIVGHFRDHCQPKIGGMAKAMVVASSRLQAFKYKQAIDEYIVSNKYGRMKTLVAFSGTIRDELGNNHTEQGLNETLILILI
jgi:type I restriction enzyme R subunit